MKWADEMERIADQRFEAMKDLGEVNCDLMSIDERIEHLINTGQTGDELVKARDKRRHLMRKREELSAVVAHHNMRFEIQKALSEWEVE